MTTPCLSMCQWKSVQVALEKEDRACAFTACWDALEVSMIARRRCESEAWLASKASRDAVLKEYKRVRREFPPSDSIRMELCLLNLNRVVSRLCL